MCASLLFGDAVPSNPKAAYTWERLPQHQKANAHLQYLKTQIMRRVPLATRQRHTCLCADGLGI